jgi:homoserine kinase
MRAALPPTVPFSVAVHSAGAGGALVAGILAGDAALVGAALSDDLLVEPVRGPLIPGFAAVKAAALAAGAFGCTISGAGPTCVAVVPDEATGKAVCGAMSAAFIKDGGLEVGSARVAALDPVGVRVV